MCSNKQEVEDVGEFIVHVYTCNGTKMCRPQDYLLKSQLPDFPEINSTHPKKKDIS